MKRIITITDKEITGSDKLSFAQPRIAVNAVLFDAYCNIALSYMGKYDLHTLPGGGVESGEDFHAALRREIWEETGCECEIIGELGQITENRSENDFTQERFYYIAKVFGEKRDLHLTDEEISQNTIVIWLPITQALKIISEKEHNNYQRKFIKARDIVALTEALFWIYAHDIPGYDKFVKTVPITKGWSSDKKYFVKAADGCRMLLRISDINEYDRKKAEYGMMERVYALGVLAPQPIDFGLCHEGKSCYSLSGWLDGEDLESVLPKITETEQYVFGLKAGSVLRKIHTLPAPGDAEPWTERFHRKVQTRVNLYHKHGLESENGKKIIKYLYDRQAVLDSRPQTFWHGDFNVGNHMITPGGEIAVFDYNYWNLDYGDPWWEFVIIPWGKEPPTNYLTGMIDGYFNNDPPHEFFNILSYYYACDALSALCYTFLGSEPEEPKDGRRHMENILRWFDNMNSPIPTWYLKDIYIQWTDGIPYKLKAQYDFSFLRKYGKVFKVFDDQDSGNICFGMDDGEEKYFIKFAGAATQRACVSIEEAVTNLKRTVPVYQDLSHPNLIKFIKSEEIGAEGLSCAGFAEVFEWVDGDCMGRQYPLSRERFLQMPLETRLQVFEDILAFHVHVAAQGYVAIDFYDGSIMYDFGNHRTVICDIDLYTKAPYTNNMGRLWGSSRFMSPEEFQLGAMIDEITNVYAMGATAFALFGDERDRSIEKWRLSKELFDVAKKAVSDERDGRQLSIGQLAQEWRAAKR